MKKDIVKNIKNKNGLNRLNSAIIITTLITLCLGIADMTLDILHTKGNQLGTAFLVIGIVMSIPGLAWLILSIILLVKDRHNEMVVQPQKALMIVISAISFVTFIPLWIEGFIDGNGMPMFSRVLYRQVIWMLVWIVYLLTNLGMFLTAYTNRCKWLYTKK